MISVDIPVRDFGHNRKIGARSRAKLPFIDPPSDRELTILGIERRRRWSGDGGPNCGRVEISEDWFRADEIYVNARSGLYGDSVPPVRWGDDGGPV